MRLNQLVLTKSSKNRKMRLGYPRLLASIAGVNSHKILQQIWALGGRPVPLNTKKGGLLLLSLLYDSRDPGLQLINYLSENLNDVWIAYM